MVKTRRRANVLLAGVSSVITGLLLAGCTDGSSDARPLPKGTIETTASRTPNAEHAEALDAYRAMWRDLTLASETSDAASPLLDDHATGGALELMKYGLQKSKREQVVSKGAPRVDPEVLSATSQKVVLVDCVDDRKWLQYKLNGELKNNAPGGHFKADATVRHSKGVWKVSDLYMHEVGSC
ncbi:hypothetical protein [Streptomyces yerevanensis]|uniref:hypothetical protein n=1 Tax=Streptomyces yerevanensis TaxID=66378 RepID=UPI000AFAB125|nr:hypothetical protein [Streptomyces yerevanensis]